MSTSARERQEVYAEKLLVYGRKSADSTDLQSCAGSGSQLVVMACGDSHVTGNEECDPPGGCCDSGGPLGMIFKFPLFYGFRV